ncbi:RNA polymerase sigma factor [Clostridium kluyveri]|uniref:RNA polymerase subunit sigma-24 n=1 Tax=Clostridium kluyveri TaxID=1534 RepID=A0A1L5F7L7_CLOKL|nr:RNA polymerase sigma factor [Clostridium kluyveri]APM39026.1 RNA polymerase subunit sigma-24 [Clostridium kluyveri]UZQ51352.1 RNA polymerase sigma factor [Clostridium kluyveri]
MMDDEKNTGVDDIKSIDRMCGATWETLYRFIYFKVQNREEAEDITQETYFKAISYIQKNNIKVDKFIGFLKTISLNILRDKWRKSKRQGSIVNFDNINPESASVEDCTEDMAQREVIQNALKLLNEEQRTVIELRILKGFSVEDTARQMNKKEGNIRVLQYRALQNLTKILKDEH